MLVNILKKGELMCKKKEIKGKRAIAYFDILGFKKKIENISIDKLASDYKSIVRKTDGEISVKHGKIIKRQVCFRYIFSDSIFLIAKEDTEESFIDLVSYAWRMMQLFILAGFSLRGAITYGEIHVDFDCNIFLGECIVKAVDLEKEQNWIGAVVDDSAINRYNAIFKNEDVQSALMSLILWTHDVPFKDGTIKNYYVLNWRENLVSEVGIKALFKNEPFDKDVQIKIDNTLKFSKEVVESGRAYLIDEMVPERYRKLFYGHKAPSKNESVYQYGDEY